MKRPELVEGRYVVLNGAMASGKTTQTKLLQVMTDAELLMGMESSQPEISSGEVYTQGSNLSTEQWFVRYHLGKLAAYPEVPAVGLVSDMSIQNDYVWAQALLSGTDLRNFNAFYNDAEPTVLQPDAACLFVLPPPTLLRRVRQRMQAEPFRAFEANTTEAFITKIQDAFIDHADMLADHVEVIDLRASPDAPLVDVQTMVTTALSKSLSHQAG